MKLTSVNPSFLLINNTYRCTEESHGNKCLMLLPTDQNSDKLEKRYGEMSNTSLDKLIIDSC